MKRARDAATGDAPSAKRQQQRRRAESTPPSSDARLSVGDDDLARLQQETLRISNEMLRSDNEQLQVELEILEESNKKLEKKVAAGQQRVQVLEGDLARWYRAQKRDAELKQAEISKLQDQLDAALKHSGLSTPAGVKTELIGTPTDATSAIVPLTAVAAVVSPETAQQVDSFLATCVQWQAGLTSASVDLEKQVSRIEEDEVKFVLSDVIARVEITTREELMLEREHELAFQLQSLETMRLAMLQQQQESERAMQQMKQTQDEADAFEALERRVLEDRVAELEVQLTQNRLREFEKNEEITSMRAEQDALNASSCVIPLTEWEAHLAEHQRLGEETDEWRLKCEVQASEATRHQEELRAVNLKLQEAEGSVKSAKALEETRAFEALEKGILEERIQELETQLKSQQHQKKIGDDGQTEQEQQQLVKLTDDLEAAQLQLSVAEAESRVKKNEVARLLNDKAELKRQIKTLAADFRKIVLQVDEYKASIGTERARSSQLSEELERLREVNKQKIVLQQDIHDRTEQEATGVKEQEQFYARAIADKDEQVKRLEREATELMQQLKQHQAAREVAQLKQLNAQLLADQEESKQQATHADSFGRPGEQSPRTVESTDELARLAHEKQAMQDFFRCYFESAETKCRQLMHELSQREARSAFERQQAKDSCDLLRQQRLETCDNSVRRAILEAVSTLERIS